MLNTQVSCVGENFTTLSVKHCALFHSDEFAFRGELLMLNAVCYFLSRFVA